jgi:SEC-C motif
MEERNDDIAQTARETIEARRFSDLTLEALRVQRDAYAASGGEAAVIYKKLRDELVVAKQRLSDREKVLATGSVTSPPHEQPPLLGSVTTPAAAPEPASQSAVVTPPAAPGNATSPPHEPPPLLGSVTALPAAAEPASRHPECRAECVGILARTLERHADTDRSINGFAVSALIDLAAVEVIDAIREAFRRKSVDISIAGDEEDVEIALGLRDWRSTPAPFYQIVPTGWLAPPDADRIQRDTHAVPRHSKVGRNDPCPCGSGRKYKKCCLQ